MTANVSVGDRDIALANQIIRVEVGSTAHGMGTGADDLLVSERHVERLGAEDRGRGSARGPELELVALADAAREGGLAF